MNPKNRNLSLRMEGEDVKRLHESLGLLGFTIEDKDGYFGKTTRQAVLEFQKTHNLEPTGVVDKRTAAIIRKAVTDIQLELDEDPRKRCCVQGNLLQPDGTPVEGAAIKAFDKDLRREKLLGETKTDNNGKYVIHYTIDQLCRLDKSSTDLIVRAYNQKGKEIATSPLILNAPPEKVVDLVVGNEVYRGPSEYIKIRTQVEPLLQDTNVTELTEEDVTYLAGKTGLDPIHIAYFAQSALLAQKTDIPAEVFYGLFRQNLPTNLPTLLVQDRKVLRSSLKTAARQNIINPKLQKQINNTLKQFQSLIINYAFKKPELGQFSFSDLLKTANLTEKEQETFLKAYLEHEGSREDFWEGLRIKFGEKAVENIQSTLQLGALTQNHLPLVKVLQAGEPTSLRNLANLGYDDWVNFINQEIDDKLVGVPPTVPGKNEEEKIKNYVKTMMRMVEDAFPTAVIAHCIDDDFPHAEALKKFFEKNPDFEFRTMKIDSYLAESEGTLDVENAEEVVGQLRAMQRLFNVAPRFDKYSTIKTLMTDEITSALAIRRMGKAAFMKTYAEQYGAVQAQQMYANASQNVAIAQMLFLQYSLNVNNFGFYALPFIYPWVKGIPEWRSLFGSLDLCECEHCRSVYSPAAYLVDILHFLDNCETDGETALDILFKRRGDIGNIELTCKNTNTLMPYVDLVNEILENAVAPNGAVYQTEGTAEELRVYPEHMNYKAYKILAGVYDDPNKKAVYPWTLPFDLPAEEIRMYLSHLGIPRYELIERFRKKEKSTLLDIASERLGLAPREWEIIAGIAPDEPYEFWGMNSGVWVEQLKKVPKFLEKSGLCYKELQKLRHVRFINSNNRMEIERSPTCSLEEETIPNLTETELNRIHRFVRLQRKLNWSTRELDAALRALRPHNLTERFLVNLSYVLHLHEKLKVPLIPLLSWWSHIDTARFDNEPSLYEKLFRNKNVMNPPNEIFELDDNELDDTKDELLHSNQRISNHIPAVLAALQINVDDLTLLIKEELLRDELNIANLLTLYPEIGDSEPFIETIEEKVKIMISEVKLTLANLSALYRAVSLAKALKLSIRDFLSLRILSGIDPFDSHDVSATIRFVEIAELVRTSDFTIAELDYLLRHQDRPKHPIAPSEKQISLILSEIRSELQKISQEYQSTTDYTGEKTKQALSILLLEPEAKEALAIVDGSSTKTLEKQKTFISDHFAVFLDATEAKEKLVDPCTMIPKKNQEDRFNYVVGPLLTYLQQGALVKQKLADALNLTMEATELLLRYKRKAIDYFLAQPIVKREEDFPTTKAYYGQFIQFLLLDKIATIITRFEIPSEELRWLFQYGPGLGWLDLRELPYTKATTKCGEVLFEPEDLKFGEDRFKAWLEMAKMAYLRDKLPPGEPTLFALLEMLQKGTNKADFCKVLCERTGWDKENLKFLIEETGFDLIFPSDFQNEKALEQLIRLKHCFEIIRVLGISAKKVWDWNTRKVKFWQAIEQVKSIRQAVRAKYGEKQWLAVAEPLRDELRERQRAALVAYIVHKTKKEGVKGIEDVDDLFGYFLIDVEMSACMMTSRIKQAISSVQLFVQRCLMNLEEGVAITPEKAKEWEWIKNYRVWEANRKVFLYPENWVEPELRDNKSQFFEDLENELLQNEVTTDTAEQVFLHYLEKLDEVKRLEICGMYHQIEVVSPSIILTGEEIDIDEQKGIKAEEVRPWSTNILHVFGRTRSTPHTYYYRQWIDEAYWTPWERVDVDIEGDHLIPVVYNRRLHLFWPIFGEKAVEEMIKEGEQPFKKYEIQMAWSEYKNGKWLAKRVSDEFIETDPTQKLPPKSLVRFWAFFHDEDLVIAPEIYEYYPHKPEICEYYTFEQFKFSGCDKHVEKGYYRYDILEPISNTFSYFMKFLKKSGSNVLKLASSGELDKRMEIDGWYLRSPFIDPVLENTPGIFSVVLPHQHRPFISNAPFFYEDNTRTLFVIPRLYGFLEKEVLI